MEDYKWIVIGVVVVILAFLFRQQIAAMLDRATKIKIKGLTVETPTVKTPIGETNVSNAPFLEPSSSIVGTHTAFVHPDYRFQMRWPLGGKWNRNDELGEAIGAVLFIAYYQEFSDFVPNVNVTIEQVGSIRVQKWIRLGEPTLQDLGYTIVQTQLDDSSQSGVRVLRNQQIAGVLYQIQRVIIRRGFAYVATASKLEAGNQVFPGLYAEMRQILNSFQVEN